MLVADADVPFTLRQSSASTGVVAALARGVRFRPIFARYSCVDHTTSRVRRCFAPSHYVQYGATPPTTSVMLRPGPDSVDTPLGILPNSPCCTDSGVETIRAGMGLFDRLDTAPYGVYAVDLSQTVVFWNSRAEQILGYGADEVLGRKCYEVVRGLALDGETPVCVQNCPGIIAARGGQIPPMACVRIQCASGEDKRVTVIPLVATDEADRVVLIHMFYEDTPASDGAGSADEPRVDEPEPLPLTPRELEVLRLLAQGLRPQDVADQLFVSVHTVRKHISNASEKLHSHGMMHAVLAAQQRHLI